MEPLAARPARPLAAVHHNRSYGGASHATAAPPPLCDLTAGSAGFRFHGVSLRLSRNSASAVLRIAITALVGGHGRDRPPVGEAVHLAEDGMREPLPSLQGADRLVLISTRWRGPTTLRRQALPPAGMPSVGGVICPSRADHERRRDATLAKGYFSVSSGSASSGRLSAPDGRLQKASISRGLSDRSATSSSGCRR